EITKIDEGKEYEIFSIPSMHTVPSVAYCFREKDKWNIDEEKLKEFGIKRGPWLKRLKKDGKLQVNGRWVRIEEVGYIKPGLKVVYTGDTMPCENILKISKDADLLIHDGAFLEEDVGSKAHADIEEAARIAKKAGVKQLILTHISRRYTDTKELEDRAKEIFPNSTVARDMMRVELKK
ncbi:MAG: MBL fold metallo-hydrolase, partial [Candidatus Aenigmatarchaeota archaeon]